MGISGPLETVAFLGSVAGIRAAVPLIPRPVGIDTMGHMACRRAGAHAGIALEADSWPASPFLPLPPPV